MQCKEGALGVIKAHEARPMLRPVMAQVETLRKYTFTCHQYVCQFLAWAVTGTGGLQHSVAIVWLTDAPVAVMVVGTRKPYKVHTEILRARRSAHLLNRDDPAHCLNHFQASGQHQTPS